MENVSVPVKISKHQFIETEGMIPIVKTNISSFNIFQYQALITSPQT